MRSKSREDGDILRFWLKSPRCFFTRHWLFTRHNFTKIKAKSFFAGRDVEVAAKEANFILIKVHGQSKSKWLNVVQPTGAYIQFSRQIYISMIFVEGHAYLALVISIRKNVRIFASKSIGFVGRSLNLLHCLFFGCCYKREWCHIRTVSYCYVFVIFLWIIRMLWVTE